MTLDKLTPNDARVQYETAQIRGKTYSYMLAQPEGEPIATMVLVHGFPDLGFGWRYQVPYFLSRGLRVIVPDMLGYGGTDAPAAVEEYTPNNTAADIRELARKFVGDKGQIILGGHDWGGATVWRAALLYPELIRAVFCVCTPFIPPSANTLPLKTLIDNGHLTNFRYQLQFAGPEVESRIQGADKLRELFRATFGGRGPAGEIGFNTQEGIVFDVLPKLGAPSLLSEEELEHYTAQYARRGPPEMRGPLNWYRMRQAGAADDAALAAQGEPHVAAPALFIAASEDAALPPSMSANMEKYFAKLRRGEVKSNHWALTQAAEDVNKQIGKWIEEEVLGGSFKAAL